MLSPFLLAALLVQGIDDGAVPTVSIPADVPVGKPAQGVQFQELIGRAATGSNRSEKASVALFHLDAGAASAWSHNKIGEESFFILSGHGTVWIGNRPQAVAPGAFILVPPSRVRSIRADKGEALDFYALTAPAWSAEDDVHVAAPDGAPR